MSPERETEQKQEWEQLRKRFSDQRAYNLITSGVWTLTHAGESKREVDEVMNLLIHLSESFERQDPALATVIGGAKGFKDKMANFLHSRDDVIAGFAATMLGISEDLRYAPAIAKLLDKKDPPEDSEEFHPPVTSRGRAAVALSRMGAREYIPKFVMMLKSRNDYDRSGAAIALGELRAREYANDVANLLNNKKFAFEDDDSPTQ